MTEIVYSAWSGSNFTVRLYIVSAMLMAASLVVSAIVNDWMWVIISAAGILVLCIPSLAKRKVRTYHRSLLILSLVPFSLYLALFAANVLAGIDVYRYLSLIIQPLASMACAYMLLASVDANSDAVISKRWLFAFSITFACAFAVLHLFFLFFAMGDMGYPLYNFEFEGPGALDNTDSNRYIMLPINLAVVFSLLYGLLIDRYLRSVDAKDLTRYYGGEEE
ncbi:MAG: hypothetical protein FWG96_03440 [Methanomassiliicoccaceae archaeon]|nr:hypothetical protein [Methanomassiliicoccaceae archaeon]